MGTSVAGGVGADFGVRIRSYPKIYNLGHAAIRDLLLDPVVVQEKVEVVGTVAALDVRRYHCRAGGWLRPGGSMDGPPPVTRPSGWVRHRFALRPATLAGIRGWYAQVKIGPDWCDLECECKWYQALWRWVTGR